MENLKKLLAVNITLFLVTFFPYQAYSDPEHTCRRVTCTIVGQGYGKNITGTSSDDVICGTAGNDVIDGKGGDDLICGNGGKDIIYGGHGDDEIVSGGDTRYAPDGGDIIYGGPGKDMILSWDRGVVEMYGGPGDDILSGGYGNDILWGEAGDDHLLGGYGNNKLFGGPGKDTLVGADGNDVIYGGAGDDALIGKSGNDFLYGEDGNDALKGESGNNALFGGPGNDMLDGGQDSSMCYGGTGQNNYRNCVENEQLSQKEAVQCNFVMNPPTIHSPNVAQVHEPGDVSLYFEINCRFNDNDENYFVVQVEKTTPNQRDISSLSRQKYASQSSINAGVVKKPISVKMVPAAYEHDIRSIGYAIVNLTNQGFYRLKVKNQITQSEGSGKSIVNGNWSEWRYFWVGRDAFESWVKENLGKQGLFSQSNEGSSLKDKIGRQTVLSEGSSSAGLKDKIGKKASRTAEDGQQQMDTPFPGKPPRQKEGQPGGLFPGQMTKQQDGISRKYHLAFKVIEPKQNAHFVIPENEGAATPNLRVQSPEKTKIAFSLDRIAPGEQVSTHFKGPWFIEEDDSNWVSKNDGFEYHPPEGHFILPPGKYLLRANPLKSNIHVSEQNFITTFSVFTPESWKNRKNLLSTKRYHSKWLKELEIYSPLNGSVVFSPNVTVKVRSPRKVDFEFTVQEFISDPNSLTSLINENKNRELFGEKSDGYYCEIPIPIGLEHQKHYLVSKRVCINSYKKIDFSC